jgi:peptide/nickel transport system substrate-binding protein
MKYFVKWCVPIVFLMYCSSCSPKKSSADGSPHRTNTVVIGIGSDVDTFNPVFAQDVTAGEIGALMYPSLVKAMFDSGSGTLYYAPMLARNWEYVNNGHDIVFHLRTDAVWADSVRITARDVQFSYEVYGDIDIASVRRNVLDRLKKDDAGNFDIRRSVKIVNDSTVTFHFERPAPSQLHDAGLPLLPAHIFDTIPRREIRTHAINRKPVGAGPFSLSSWKPGEEISLISNPLSVLPMPAKLDRLVFRVLPDHGSRFAQLKSCAIDIMSDLSPPEARELAASALPVHVVIAPARRYQFVGWNNIDGTVYAASGGKNILPHRLFGSIKTRTALTMAINRQSIRRALLEEYGLESIGPVSPIFRYAYNDSIRPVPFDPAAARELLKQDGWMDTDNDGILEKGTTKFSFALTIPAGSQFTLELATIIQKQLRDVHIAAEIHQVEASVFWQKMMEKKFDAFIGGFEVSLRLKMTMFWGSDLRKSPFNLVSYRNRYVDQLLNEAESQGNEADAAPLWQEFQAILAKDQPCTFLFWENNVIGVNKRIKGANISILGTTSGAWEWSTE